MARAELLVVAAGRVIFSLNGEPVEMSHSSKSQDNGRLVDVTRLMRPGMNTLRAEVENAGTGAAGLIAQLTATTEDGRAYTLATDETWRATDHGGSDWKTRGIGATEWPSCQVIGPAGCEPWGELMYTPLLLPPRSCLRTEFNVPKKVRRAILYGTALGLVDFHLNGHLVSEDRFTPGWTDYTKRVHYRAYEVTKLLREGRNALGAILADGWYSGYVAWGVTRERYGKKPRVRAQLQIDYTDGSHDIIASGPEWKASTGPTRSADFLMGESYDARLAQPWTARILTTADGTRW